MTHFITSPTDKPHYLSCSRRSQQKAFKYLLCIMQRLFVNMICLMQLMSWRPCLKGFTYKSNLVWYKVRKDGGPDGRGVVFYFLNVMGLILFRVRRSKRTLQPDRKQVNILSSRKREHSKKPDEIYDLIESCSQGQTVSCLLVFAALGGNSRAMRIWKKIQYTTLRNGSLMLSWICSCLIVREDIRCFE